MSAVITGRVYCCGTVIFSRNKSGARWSAGKRKGNGAALERLRGRPDHAWNYRGVGQSNAVGRNGTHTLARRASGIVNDGEKKKTAQARADDRSRHGQRDSLREPAVTVLPQVAPARRAR